MRAGARGIQSIEVSGRILQVLVKASEPLMLKDLAQAAGLAPAQCHAYLTSLRHVGFVHQDMNSGLYSMGAFAMRLGISWLLSSPISSAAITSLNALTADIGLMSLVTVWGEMGPTIVHFNDGIRPMALNIKQGTLFSVTGTATGRVFAAFGQLENLEAHIELELDQSSQSASIGSAMSRVKFNAQVEETQRLGYSIADEAPIPGINAVSAPIFDQNGDLALVATLIGPAEDLPVNAKSEAVLRLCATTRAITAKFSDDGGSSLPVKAPKRSMTAAQTTATVQE